MSSFTRCNFAKEMVLLLLEFGVCCVCIDQESMFRHCAIMLVYAEIMQENEHAVFGHFNLKSEGSQDT